MFILLMSLACSKSDEAPKAEDKPAADQKVAAPAPDEPAPATEEKQAARVDNSKPTDVSALTPVTTPSGLKIWALQEGTGAAPQKGQVVAIHYTGWLKTGGPPFDSSLDRGRPMTFPLGGGRVIPGWEEGVATMKVGGKSQFEIPAALAYGDRGAGDVIPAGATLVYDIELVEVK